jgi:probable HAF family extracellular repeat protein
MRHTRSLILAIPALLIAAAWPQLTLAAHRITTFDPPGAGTGAGQGTFAQQNLNSGVIVGYYVDANNVSHGFIRSPHGKYTIIDVPGAAGTLAFGINDEGTVVGWGFEANGVYHGFLRDEDGHFTTFDVPGAGPFIPQANSPLVILPLPLTINSSGTVAGDYVDKNNVFHGFVRSPDGNITSFDPAGSVATFGDTSGITRAGTIAGGYLTADGVNHGFVRDPEGAITSFDAPDAGTTKEAALPARRLTTQARFR